MSKFALIKNGAFTGRVEDFDLAPKLPGKPSLKWVNFVSDGPPTFNPKLQILERPTYTAGPNSVTETFQVRAKTQEEFDDEDMAVVDSLPARLLFEVIFDLENRVRGLEGAPAVSRAQTKTLLLSTHRSI